MKWTQKDVLFLRMNYSHQQNGFIATRLWCKVEDVVKKADELTLKKDKRWFPGTRMPRWTDKDLAKLRKLYPTVSNLNLARIFKRSAKSIVSIAKRMDLKKGHERLVQMGRENAVIWNKKVTHKKGSKR